LKTINKLFPLGGGHINPAVSLMFVTFKKLSPVRFLLYFLVQLAGAFFGAAVAYMVYCGWLRDVLPPSPLSAIADAINKFDDGTRQVYGTKGTAHIFASYSAPHLGTLNGLLDQIVATAIFCLMIAHITVSF
jgi:glycerol uptake facilitator-like aquaporin